MNSVIRLGRGSIVVERPDEQIKKTLKRFRHDTGEYEDLFSLSSNGQVLATMPGFASRLQGLGLVIDGRMRMPEPDLAAMAKGMSPAWNDVVAKAVKAGGGIIEIPGDLWVCDVVEAILRAYPRNRLLDRGTPMCVVAAENSKSCRALAEGIQKRVPQREVGIMTSSGTDVEDVVVATYRNIRDIRMDTVGLFIGTGITPGFATFDRVGNISGIRNAARFGILENGMSVAQDIAVEGLFGPTVAAMTHAEAIRLGEAMPVTVCWLPCKRPNTNLGSTDPRLLEALSLQENPAVVDMVAKIAMETPDELGCLVLAETNAMAKRVRVKAPDLLTITHGGDIHARRNKFDGMKEVVAGNARKALLVSAVPKSAEHRVAVVANCHTAELKWFPWRKKNGADKAYIVDFLHDWDVHNGRPGYLARNDEARKMLYRQMGFSQMTVGKVDELPFIG